MERIERSTSPLPRECSTTELHGRLNVETVECARHCAPSSGAGEGNRTLVVSLEGFCSTIELHPRFRSQKTGIRSVRFGDGALAQARIRVLRPCPTLTERPSALDARP